MNELKEAIVKDNKLLTSLSSVSGGTASKVKKALSETNTKPRWVQVCSVFLYAPVHEQIGSTT